VAFDVTPLLTFRTGIGQSVQETWAALNGLDPGPDLIPYALGLRAKVNGAGLPAGIRPVRAPTRLLLAMWSRSDHPGLNRSFRGADVVHATNYVIPPTRIPTLATINDVGFVLDPGSADSVVGTFPALLRRALARGAYVHVTTHQVAAEVDEHFGPGLISSGRITVVPFGIPPVPSGGPLPASLAAQVKAPYVLAVGRHEPRKNLPRLVHAFGEVAREEADLLLVIAGPDGRGTPALTASIADLAPDLRNRVRSVGPVPPAALGTLLAGATALAYPSLYEGFGFPPLEAMTVGVPVLVGRGGAVSEVTGPAAEQVDPLDVSDLAAGLRRVVFDQERRAELIASGRRHAATYTWERTARGFAELYERLAISS
jgi:glycosyltransferase involved in cell wall biosynthesis